MLACVFANAQRIFLFKRIFNCEAILSIMQIVHSHLARCRAKEALCELHNSL
jgi:hypothetical protein